MKKDFLSIADLTEDEIFDIFYKTKDLKIKFKNGDAFKPLRGKTMSMIFQKPSRVRDFLTVGNARHFYAVP